MTDVTTPTTPSTPSKVDSKVACVIAYIIGPIYLLIEKNDKTVRFHALQATFLYVALIAVNMVISILQLWFLSSLVSLGAFILWMVLMVKAYQGEKIVLPIIGEYAQKYA